MATKVRPLTGAPVAGNAAVNLSNEEILRYSRHLIMPEVGMEGQLKLKRATVLLIGTGGLGAPLGLYFSVGRAGNRVRHAGRAVLPLLVSRAASAGARPVVRGGRRARRTAGDRRLDSGHGDDQADSGARRQPCRSLVAVRCAGNEVSRAEAAQKSELPDVRRASHDHRVDRLLRILRRARGRSACIERAGSGDYPARTEIAPGSRR